MNRYEQKIHTSEINNVTRASICKIKTNIPNYIVWVSTKPVDNAVVPQVKITTGLVFVDVPKATMIRVSGKMKIVGELEISKEDQKKLMAWVIKNNKTLSLFWQNQIEWHDMIDQLGY